MLGLSLTVLWILFAVVAAGICVAGTALSRYGDVIGDKTGLGGGGVGLLLIATVTSLPEVAAGISAVTVADAPDIAVGGVLGSCVFNLAILAVLDAMCRGPSLYECASRSHRLAGGVTIAMLVVPVAALAWPGVIGSAGIGFVAWTSPVLLVGYVLGMRLLLRREKNAQKAAAHDPGTMAEPEKYAHLALSTAVTRFSLAALAVLVAGILLPEVADAIAVKMNWGETFVGTLLVAGVTSLPELVVVVSAARIGAWDMAVADVLGSNLFNVAILGLEDLVYTKGALLAHASSLHLISALSAIAMTLVAMLALGVRLSRRPLGVMSLAGVVLLAMFMANSWMLYRFS